LNRREEENFQEGEVKEFLSKNPSMLDKFLKHKHGKSNLTQDNLDKIIHKLKAKS